VLFTLINGQAQAETEVVPDPVTAGRLALAEGRVEAARTHCLLAVRTPRRSDALTCLGEVEFAQGRYQLAARLGAAALKIRGSIATHLLIAHSWQALLHCEWATPHFEQVLIVEPDNPNITSPYSQLSS
jgi:Tfp pilus assembly protein PilF